ncbi:MAG: glycosyltransferase [bacterium]|nr:glycosyltransferase [bacterium]
MDEHSTTEDRIAAPPLPDGKRASERDVVECGASARAEARGSLGDASAHQDGQGVITIAHLIGRWGIGGLEGQLAQVVNRLPADRFRHVIVFRNGYAAVGPKVREGVEIISLDDPARNRAWALRLARLLTELKVDLVHNRELFTIADTVTACRIAGVPRMAFSFHGFTDEAAAPSMTTRWRWRRALRRYHARWSVSEAARHALAQTLGVRPTGFKVLRNGVDSAHFRPGEYRAENRRRLSLPTDRTILLAVGNLSTVKNHQLILEAIHTANLPADRYTLAIVGEDRLNGQLQRWAAAKLPEHDIRFPGVKRTIVDWYQAADVLLLPSRSEGLCNALLEAMACELAVVATDVPGNREVLRNEVTGLLAPPENPQAFGAAIRRLVAEPKLRRRLGHNARTHVCEEYSLPHTVDAYARAYAQLCPR